MTTTPTAYKADVREQYEDFPYPYRNPNDEGTLFHGNDPQSLMALSHAAFGGTRDLRRGARLLNAGCGTGDTSVLWAEEILEGDSELVSIDLSASSLAIARARLEKRGIVSARTSFHHLSILDLPNSGLGQFDVIECGGVLHHLPDPEAGLKALTSMLKPDGILTVMVYGRHGRLPVYLVQDLMKHLVAADAPRAEKIAIAREFLANVPMGHWLAANSEPFIADISWPDGSGIYDLFLHSTDRAYTVPEIYDWTARAGLHWLSFYDHQTDGALYRPERYTASALLRGLVAAKPTPAREEIAELMHGHMGKHYFYAAREAKTAAAFADDMVIDYGLMQHFFLNFREPLLAQLSQAPLGASVNGRVRPTDASGELNILHQPHTAALLRAIDGERSVAQLVDAVAQAAGADAAAVRRELEQLYHALRACQAVFLRHASIPRYRNLPEINTRLKHSLARSQS